MKAYYVPDNLKGVETTMVNQLKYKLQIALSQLCIVSSRE